MKGKKRFIKLTSEDRASLEEGHKRGELPTFRQRCHYILLSDRGKKIGEISEIFEVNRLTIGRWFDRYEAEGIAGLHTAKGRGRPSIIRIDNETEVTRIEELVEKSPQNLKPVLAAIEKEFGKTMSKRTLQRILEKKWTWKRFRRICPKKPESSELKRKSGLLNWLILMFLSGHIDLRYADETAFTLQPNIPYGWIRKGEQRAGLSSSNNIE